VPLLPGRAPRTAVVYRIADPLLRFWFRFVEPHWSTLRRFTPHQAFEQIVAPQWDAFCGEGFERMCREALPLLYGSEHVGGRFEVGEYWDRAVQIDVVGLRADGWIDLGECKWATRAAPAQTARDLVARATRYPAAGRTVRHRLFLRSAPRTALPDVAVHDLRALYDG
jgi:AAA+ ATPase superfamily predicted ATPase